MRINAWGIVATIAGILLQSTSAYAVILNVPEEYASIEAAVDAARLGDVVQINDSGLYAESLLIEKGIILRAAVGENPVLRAPDGEAHAIRIFTGADSARVGDSGYGRITVMGGPDASALVHVGGDAVGAVEIENLTIVVESSATQGIRLAGEMDATFRDIRYIGSGAGETAVYVENLGGGSARFERSSLVAGSDIGVFFAASTTAGGEFSLLGCQIDVDKRPIVVDPGAGPFSLVVDTSWIQNRDTTQGWDLLSFRADNWDIFIRQAVLRNRGTGSTVFLFPANGSSMQLLRSDILGANVCIRQFDGMNRTVLVRDNNIVGPNVFLRTMGSGDSFTTTYNNAPGNRNGVPLGAGDRSSPVTPGYQNTDIGKFLYSQSSLRTGGSTGGPLGTYLDFSDSPFNVGQDNTYTTAFSNYWVRGPQPVPVDMDEYNTRVPFDRFLGDPLNTRLLFVELGIYSPMVGLDIWGEALNAMAKATGDVKYIRENLELIRRVLAVRDDRREPPYQLWDGRTVPTWSDNAYSSRGREIYSLHTGSIIYSMFEWLLLVDENPEFMAELEEGEYEYILSSIQEALAVHDVEWFDGPGADEGHYRFEMTYADIPYRNQPVPFNWFGTIGRSLWMSWLVSGNEEHRDRAIKLARYIKNRLYYTPDGGYAWEYFLTTNPVSGSISRNVIPSEDTNHGVFSMMFPALMAKHETVFYREDALRFAKTVENGLFRLGGGIALSDMSGEPNRFEPQYTSAVAIALHFAEAAPYTYPLVSDFNRLWRSSPGTIDGAFMVYYHDRLVTQRNSGTPPDVVPVSAQSVWMIY